MMAIHDGSTWDETPSVPAGRYLVRSSTSPVVVLKRKVFKVER